MIAVVYIVESGCVEGLGDSVRPGNPVWFSCCVRGLCYGAISPKTGLEVLLWSRYQSYKLRRVSRKSKLRPVAGAPLPTASPIEIPAPPASEPSSGEEASGCMPHVISTGLERRAMSLSQTVCSAVGEVDVQMLN